jgi:hypothetical protein
VQSAASTAAPHAVGQWSKASAPAPNAYPAAWTAVSLRQSTPAQSAQSFPSYEHARALPSAAVVTASHAAASASSATAAHAAASAADGGVSPGATVVWFAAVHLRPASPVGIGVGVY